MINTNIVAQKSVWNIFADPRALHYENQNNTINMTYIGYIDIHGNIKATQYNFLTNTTSNILIRSCFQPDDHNNVMFLILPDERVMVFYTRHTDENKIWYRISKIPGDITQLGNEKYIKLSNFATYPCPFILSNDLNHIYLCWRGINWHPTIGRLTLPDNNDNCFFDIEPKQIIQSTAARPYTKYCSNNKDKIYMYYTTGHPGNEYPNWLYFNIIYIDENNDILLTDINNNKLTNISNNELFYVNKLQNFYDKYKYVVVDNSPGIRNWVAGIAIDKVGNPVMVYIHVDDKNNISYYYAKWFDNEWKIKFIEYGGHAFHKNWHSTEKCFSGGITIDDSNPNKIYLSIPTIDNNYNINGIFELWEYTINDDCNIVSKKQLTKQSVTNNVRPYVIQNSKKSKLKLVWLNGDYYYWLKCKQYPFGYQTNVCCDFTFNNVIYDNIYLQENIPISFFINMGLTDYIHDELIFKINDNIKYIINNEYKKPEIIINDKIYTSENLLYSGDNWGYFSTGTNSDFYPTKLNTWILTIIYKDNKFITYRNGYIDQVIDNVSNICGKINIINDNICIYIDNSQKFVSILNKIDI